MQNNICGAGASLRKFKTKRYSLRVKLKAERAF